MNNIEIYSNDYNLDLDFYNLDKVCDELSELLEVSIDIEVYIDGIVISIHKLDEHGFKIRTRTYKYGKRPFTIKKIISKIKSVYNAFEIENQWVNLRSEFSKLNLPGDVYYTSFGFSYWNMFKSKKEWNKENDKIKSKLNELGIKFSNEYSDAFWVYRYKISKSKNNLQIIKNLKQGRRK